MLEHLEKMRVGCKNTGILGRRILYRASKRFLDVVFSTAVILVLLIPVCFLCVAIAIDSPGAPIYIQKRLGLKGREIKMLKLRTMIKDSEDVEKYFNDEQLRQWRSERKVDADPRITRIGKLLRATSFDELPQFLNVVAGSMSVVGPRPIVEDELRAYGSKASEFLSVKPGITGWWQVCARNSANHNDGSRQELELYYARNANLALDARIFFKTFGVMFAKKTGR